MNDKGERLQIVYSMAGEHIPYVLEELNLVSLAGIMVVILWSLGVE